jgi:hypothetical protein
MTYQVGDTRRPTLTLSAFDGSTVVVLTTVCEATGVSTVRATTGVAGTWTANASYTLTSPGRWAERWVVTNAVTGLGAGSESLTIDVDPLPPALGPGQTGAYATVQQYADIIGGTLPTNLARLLRVASRQLDDFLFSSIYDTTSVTTLATLAEATCEQVAYMGANGWWTTGGVPALARSVSIGSVSLGAPSGSSAGGGSSATIPRISPIAYSLLVNAGLVGGQPDTFALGGWWV